MELFFLDALVQASLGHILLKTLLNALALMAGAHLLRGVEVADFTRALIVAVLLSVLNATLGAILDWLSFPLRILTLGLFSFVVDAVVLLLAAYLLKGFTIRNFGSAFFLAIVLAIVNGFLYAIFL